MPLFFILSGFTYKVPSSIGEFPRRIIRNIKSLLIPSILASVIVVLGYWIQSGSYSFYKLQDLSIKMIEAWWWASGVKVNNHPGLGALWFLTTLFWLRVIVDIIIIVFKKRYEWFVFVLLAAIGVFLGKHRIWLPQNMDVTLVALLFFYIGIQLKNMKFSFLKIQN